MENEYQIGEARIVPRDDEALLNITWKGANGDLAQPLYFNASDADVKAFAAEAVRAGDIIGINADPAVNFVDFIVDRFPAKDGQPARIFLRPKTPFGGVAPEVEAPKPKGLIEFTDFEKLDLRAGQIVEATPQEGSDKLLVLKVAVGDRDTNGEPTTRQIVAGIGKHYKPEDLIDRVVVVVTNLKPRELRGDISHGMLLAAGGKLLTVNAEPGTSIG